MRQYWIKKWASNCGPQTIDTKQLIDHNANSLLVQIFLHPYSMPKQSSPMLRIASHPE